MLARQKSVSKFFQHNQIKSAEPSNKSGGKSGFTVLEGHFKTDTEIYINIMGFPDIKYKNIRKGNTNKRYYNRSRSSEENDSTKKDREIKFQMHGQNVAPTATYKKLLEHIIVRIQPTFDRPINIVKSIREKHKYEPTEPKWTRVRILTDNTDDIIDEKKSRQHEEDMKYMQDWNRYEQENEWFEEDLLKTYALIYGSYCTSEMRTAIKEDPKFESEIRDEPLRVLALISTLMYTPALVMYLFSTLAETATVEADEINKTSADVLIDKYDSAVVRVDKYNVTSNGTSLGKLYTTVITGVDDEFIRDVNKCSE